MPSIVSTGVVTATGCCSHCRDRGRLSRAIPDCELHCAGMSTAASDGKIDWARQGSSEIVSDE